MGKRLSEEDIPQEFLELLGVLDIDEEDPLSEWHRIKREYVKVAYLAAKATEDRGFADLKAKTVAAEVSASLRRDGLGEGVKVTEDALKAAVIRDPKVISAEVTRLKMATREAFLDDLKEGLRMTERALMRITVLLGYGVPVEEESQAVRAASTRIRREVMSERGLQRASVPQ